MIYTVNYTSWNNINFNKHIYQLNASGNVYNRVSVSAPNPKEILSIKVVSSNEIEIKLYSKNVLTPGREANALWLFSHELAENQGFDIYLTSQGKLLKSA